MGDDEQSLQDGELAGQNVGYVDPWVGQYLADYYIIRRIGEGGMGIVYLARHQSLDRLAAVKFLGAHMVNDKSYIDRFLNEARGAAKLNHPNIVAVYDAGSIGEDIYYFIMEYVEGRDLGSMLRERNVFPVPESVGYIRQAASALGYAHKKRIIHRDIKPDNLMLTNDGVIKVGDLGLAKWISDDGSGGMTQSGIVMGTPFYISPEQVRGSRDVDARSDIYSLGASLYHMVVGRIPYEGTSPAVIMAMHLNSPVPEPTAMNRSLDSDICGIIKKMMAKNPAERFQTMEEVDAILLDYQSGKMRSAQFLPGAAVPLPFTPSTEPQQIPSGPPERLHSPNVIQSEPGAPLKIASIIGLSIIVAAVILGFFLTSVVQFKREEQAVTPPPPSPAPASAQPQGFVANAKPVEIKLPEALPPEPVAQHVAPPAPPPQPAPTHVTDFSQNTALTLASAPTSPLETAHVPTQPTQPAHSERPGFVPIPEDFEKPAPETMEIVGIMPNGEVRSIIGPMGQSIQNTLQSSTPLYGQNFNVAGSGMLPRGVRALLVDMSQRFAPQGPGGGPMGGGQLTGSSSRKKNEILVGAAGYENKSAQCYARWSIEKDPTAPGGQYLKLWHDTQAREWLFGVVFDPPAPIRNKKFMVVYTLRSGEHPAHVELATMPESGMASQIPIDQNWKVFIAPKPQLSRTDLKSIMVGIMGAGELHIADVRVSPVPKEMESMFDRQPTNQPPMGMGGRTSKKAK
jgi:serine/threonine-protein kinase